MIELLFKNNVHEIGPNTTMRKGVKWSIRLQGVDEVVIRETGSSERGVRAKILNVNVMRMLDLYQDELKDSSLQPSAGQRMLNIQHDPACRHFNGLMHRMCAVYGDGKISAYDIITIIEYEMV